ncbi:dihydrodipicolinate synthase family protein, partial [Rhizobium johnstonii]|uniref:dihydrodipicolinate synthase family protein n=1 Tax=Rhizobium johnstonii TaxID=3019933 RepID=UPI003F992C01
RHFEVGLLDIVAAVDFGDALDQLRLQIGTGAEDKRESIRLSVKAEAMGADGVMIIPPFYSTPTDDEIVNHYKSIASAVTIQIMVYNNPATA